MTITTKRVLAACTFLVAAAINVAVGMLTQEWSTKWVACLAILLVVGVLLQVWLTTQDRTNVPRQEAADIDAKEGFEQKRRGGLGEQSANRVKTDGKFIQSQED
ncbi:hypothetical protein ACWEP4_33110 [Streptomyces sp. NPDC004227]